MAENQETDMFAVVRETTYPDSLNLAETPAFAEFQSAHEAQPGYVGSIVVALGEGRFATVTLWTTKAAMDAARDAIGPTVGRTLAPLMTAEAVLTGTGPVVFNDLTK